MEDTLRMNSVVCEAGADAAMILPPYYFAADEETLYRYYSALAHKTSFPHGLRMNDYMG
jgi:dihydrodipicolinate synthase/N-acetylneuraminate lyase